MVSNGTQVITFTLIGINNLVEFQNGVAVKHVEKAEIKFANTSHYERGKTSFMGTSPWPRKKQV